MKYGFIGCGNMGGALAAALSKSIKDIYLYDIDFNKASELAARINAMVCDINDLISGCDAVFLGVKPQIINEVLEKIADNAQKKDTLFISMAAGVAISDILNALKYEAKIIRIMPNMPVAVGEGMIVYDYSKRVSQPEVKDFLSDMKYAGKFDRICEKNIDAACALSGCGPAFMYMAIEALADGAVSCGLTREKALEYAAQTMKGASQMYLATSEHPESLKDRVCSPGGSTIKGVEVLESFAYRAALSKAVIAAYEKSRSLK